MSASVSPSPPGLLTPAEVAELFRVTPKTVARWARAGQLCTTRTPGGHRRYRAMDVLALRDSEVLALREGIESPAPPRGS